MAWTKDSNGGIKRLYNLDLGTTLDENGLVMAAAGATVSSDALIVGKDVKLGTIGVTVEVDDSPAGDVDWDLLACNAESGTYSVVAASFATKFVTGDAANTYRAGTVDLSLYPFNYFKIGLRSTADDSGSHARIIVSQDDGPQADMTISGIGADPS